MLLQQLLEKSYELVRKPLSVVRFGLKELGQWLLWKHSM